ncbi:MAG: FtsX-like permease family protein, partial [Chitinivibrionales bacterium]|nr:FtsX-like permease family protein [Chitinivibrionales bacterium]
TGTVSAAEKTLLTMDNNNLDDLFAPDSLFVPTGKSKRQEKLIIKTDTAKPPAAPVDIDAGTYNMVLVFLKPGEKLNEGLIKLNSALATAHLNARAVSWQKSIGPLGSMTALIKGALFVFVSFLFFVAIIIIVNTLSMAALERTTEIGMMRAVGAKKSFISMMFVSETAVLSFLFGGIGIICGVVLVNILARLNITSDNDMVQLLYGGDTFRPLLSLADIALVVFQLAVVTLIAVLYPTKVARGIRPLDAIARD